MRVPVVTDGDVVAAVGIMDTSVVSVIPSVFVNRTLISESIGEMSVDREIETTFEVNFSVETSDTTVGKMFSVVIVNSVELTTIILDAPIEDWTLNDVIDVDDPREFVDVVDKVMLLNDTGNCELGAGGSSSTVVVLTSITETFRQIIGYASVPKYLQPTRCRHFENHQSSLIIPLQGTCDLVTF